jgi:serine/threonine protein kinase
MIDIEGQTLPSAQPTRDFRPLNALGAGVALQEFQLGEVIGEGGFGIVYKAFDTLLQREVAIKEFLPVSHAARTNDGRVVPRSEAHREILEKGLSSFLDEARMLARFKHPALVEVLRFWEENGTAYMVMPFYRGKSLSKLVQEGFRLSTEKELSDFVRPLISGLRQLHAKNCYHRDISADNILLLENGVPLLLDFGAARTILVSRNQLSTVILKPGFAPIEQYSEDHDAAPQGAWTDIYALSAVLYLLISGKMPSVSVARIMRDPQVPLSSVADEGFRPAVLEAIDHGLKVNPQDRPQSVEEFERSLLLECPISLLRATETPLAEVDVAPVEADSRLMNALGVERVADDNLAMPEARGENQAERKVRIPLLISGLVVMLLIAVVSLNLVTRTEVQALPEPPPITMSDIREERLPVIEPQESAKGEEAPLQEVVEPAADHHVGQGAEGMSVDRANVEPAAKAESPVVVAEVSPPSGIPVPPLVKEGVIEVLVRPWGSVFLDGKLIGSVPPRLKTSLKPGNYELEIRNETHAPFKLAVEVVAGQHRKIQHVFGNE